MNKSYRLIWSDLIQAWVAVAEFARARGKKAGAVLCAAGLASGALAAPPAPTALPTGGQIVAGQVAIAQGGARMDITQGSAKAIINWSSFDIGSSAQVHFHQPSASAMALNRVQSSDPSQIFGQLSANGQVFLVNPNGVLFGPGARVDVGGIVASTLNLANEDFLAGNYRFTGGNGAAGITNQGLLTALPQGYVALVAPKIANTGTINAPRGTVALAAGDTVTLQFANDRLLSYDVAAAQVDTLIAQQGAVRAEGGVVLLTAKSAGELATSAINHTGLTDASSASAEGGMIRLEGGFVAMGGSVKADGQTQGGHIEVQAAGTLSLAENVSAVGHGGAGGSVSYASGGRTIETSTSHTDASGATDGGSIRVDAKGGILSSGTYVAKGGSTGGRIDVGGDTVRLLSANLDASGNAGGGLVRVGGAFQGGKGVPDATAYDLFVARWPAAPAIGNSRRVFLNDGTRVNVSSSQGVGGTVVVWSNQETTQLGSINAAGAQGGGAVEISSAEVLRHAGLSGISGARFLLLDPKNIIIGDAAAVSSWSYQAVLGKDYTSSGSNANANSLEGGDWFGFAVAINSAANLMAVGTHGDDGATNGASDSGAVHLFRFTDGSFGGGSLEGIIGRDYTGGKNVNVPGLYAGAYFGRSVALNGAGDRLAVGATFYGSGGSVFLFSFTDSSFSGGTQQAIIGYGSTGGKNVNASFLDYNDAFGSSVALNAVGDRLAVGAVSDGGYNNTQPYTGAVHLFSFTDGNFSGGTLQGTVGKGYSGSKDIDMPTLPAGRFFGQAVALNGNGDRLAVGVGDDGFSASATNSGAVHLFSFTDGNFSGGSLQGTIGYGYTGGKNVSVANLEAGDYFGSAVSFNAAGDRLAVGAPSDGGYMNLAGGSGAVYLFSFTDTSFTGGSLSSTLGKGYTLANQVNVANLEANDSFGQAVALNGIGDRLAVGGSGDWGSGNILANSNSGAVRLFTFENNTFIGGIHVGTVGKGYTGGKNVNVASLEMSDGFGSAVALNAAGDRLAVGVPNDAGFGNAVLNSGAVHLFSFTDKNFNGAVLEASLGKGYTGGKNIDVASLEMGDRFGQSVALNGTGKLLAVGAPYDSGSGNVATSAGAVYLFSFLDNTFSSGSLVGTVGKGYTGGNNVDVPSLEMSDGFGSAVALNAVGDRLAVGAPNDAGFGNGVLNSGAVHLFSFTDGSFSGGTLQATLGKGYSGGKNIDVSNLAMGDRFGQSVAFNTSGTRLAVGAPFDTPPPPDDSLTGTGAVYLFGFLDNLFLGGSLLGTIGWGYTGIKDINMGSLEMNDNFGFSVALNAAGDRLAVGTPNDAGFGNGAMNSGAVYLFSFTDGSFTGGTLQSTLGKGYGGANDANVSDLESNDRFGQSVALNAAGNRLAVGALNDSGPSNATASSGAVYLFSDTQKAGSDSALGQTFANHADQSITVSRVDLETQLGMGTSVVLQASNDITVSGPIIVTPASGNGGNLTLQAGRNINFNANITTANGSLTAIAGDGGADPAFRDPGTPTLTIASGVILNVGTGIATLAAIAGNVVNNAGDGAIATSGAGRWLVYAADPSSTTEGFTNYNKHYNQIYDVAGTTPTYASTGNWFLYSLAPTLSVTPGAATITYGNATPTFVAASYSGFIDGDSSPGTVTGTANWTVGGPFSTAGHATAGSHNVTYGSGLLSSLGYLFTDNTGSTAELTVNARALTAAGITASNKIYDATLAATLNFGSAALSGVIAGDLLSLDTSGASGTFANKNVGTGKAVTVTGLALSGTDAGNYTVSDASGATAGIAARAITATGITASNKVYDAGTAATLNWGGAALNGVIAGDALSLDTSGTSGTFANKNVGTGKAVTVTGLALSGTDAGNYTVSDASGATAGIAARAITATGITASDKVYDTTTTASLNLAGAALSGVMPGDLLSLYTMGASGSFADKNVGTGKAVTVTGLSLMGTDAGNYTLSGASGTAANITPASLVVSGVSAANKVYDATTLATLSGGSVSALGSDSITLLIGGAIGAFADKNVGSAKAVTASSYALSGPDAGNYTLIQPTGLAADITPATLTLTAVANSKTYDAGTSAAATPTVGGLRGADTVTGLLEAYADKNVGTGKTLNVVGYVVNDGNGGANYAVTTVNNTSGVITPATLAISGLTAQNKVYDATTAATLIGGSVSALMGDSVALLTGGAIGAFADKNVGSGKAVTASGYTLSGPDAGNYTLIQPTGLSADITPVFLSVSGAMAQNKVYDATMAATLTGGSVAALMGDSVTLVTGGAGGTFADKNVGSAKAVTASGYSLSGLDAGNYALIQPTGLSADITPASLILTAAPNTKTYDATTGAAALPTVSGLQGADTVSGLTEAYADKNAGTGKTLVVTGYTINDGNGGKNYTVSKVSGASGEITPALLAYEASPAKATVGQALPALSGTVTGFVGGETQASDTTGTPAWTTPATASSTAGTYAIDGNGLSAANYTFVQASANATALTLAEASSSAGPSTAQDSGTIAAQTQTTASAPIVSLPPQDPTQAGVIIDNQMTSPTSLTATSSTTLLAAAEAAGNAGAESTGKALGKALEKAADTAEKAAEKVADKAEKAADKAEKAVEKSKDKDDKPAEKKQEAAKTAQKTDGAIPKGAAAFARINLASMTPAAVQAMLTVRHEVKTQALQEGLAKLQVDKKLAELKGCASAAAAVGGDCLATPLQMKELIRSTQPTIARPPPVFAALPAIEKKVAVLIGSNAYQDKTIPSLDSPVPDVEAVAKILEQRLGYEVRILRDAGKKDMVKAFNRIAGELGNNDSVTVYYAGHGYQSEETGTGYWIPADAKASDPGTWISNQDVSRFLSQLPAKQVMLISDSCYSGSLAKGGRESLGKAANAGDILGKRSVVVMSSGGEEPVSDEGRNGHSIFAYSLMEALNGVNSWQTGSAVHEKVQAAVTKEFPQSPQYGAATAAGHTAGGEYLLEVRRNQ